MVVVNGAVTPPTIFLADFIQLCMGLEAADCLHQPETGPWSGPRTFEVLQSIIIPIQLDRVSCNGNYHEIPSRTEQHIRNGTANCHGDVRGQGSATRLGRVDRAAREEGQEKCAEQEQRRQTVRAAVTMNLTVTATATATSDQRCWRGIDKATRTAN